MADDEVNLVSPSSTAQSDVPASPETTNPTDEVNLVSSSFTAQSDVPESPEAINPTDEKKAWHESITEDLQRTAGSALQSARSLQLNPSSHLRTLQDLLPQAKSQFQTYEDAFFKKIKDQLMSAREHPAVAGGVAVTAALVLMRGPRRFLFRQTLGRFQSEEAQFLKAEKNVKELSLSTDLVKKDSRKLFERVALAEKDLKRGNDELMNAGRQIQRLVKSVYKVETQANDLMDGLREIPGREALKLRAEVASMASASRQQRIAQDKRIMKISDLGFPI